jgi:hypothetical protein
MPTIPRPRHAAFTALLAQLAAVLLAWLMLLGAAQLGVLPGLLGAACLQGVCAALIGERMGLSAWWRPINLAFVPGLVLLQDHSLPPWLLLTGFVLLVLLNWNAFIERVPLYLTGAQAERQLAARLAELPPGFRFVDLGSGLGGTLLRLARAYPNSQFLGVETAPLTFLLCWLRCLPQGNCTVRMRSLWGVDLGDFEVVYCFLSPAPMPALWDKACAQMQPGALLISNSFEVPGMPAEESLPLGDWRGSQLLLWRPGARPPDVLAARG